MLGHNVNMNSKYDGSDENVCVSDKAHTKSFEYNLDFFDCLGE